MKIKRILGILLFSIVLGQQILWAEPTSNLLPQSTIQEDKTPATQEDVTALRSELQQVRDQFQRNYDLNTANTQRSLKISGLIQTRYSSFSPTTTNATGTYFNTFSVPLALISFKGNLRKDYEDGKNVDYTISVGTNPAGNQIVPIDAFLSYSILPSNQVDLPRLSVSVGQQKKPFGLEATALEDKAPTIRLAQFVAGTGSLDLASRDIGLIFSGDLFPAYDVGYSYRAPLIQYYLGVLNGNGNNTVANKNTQDRIGRVVINAPVDYNSPFRGLSIGASSYTGVKAAYVQASVTANPAATGVFDNGIKNRVGYDIAYVNTPVGFTYEVARGLDEALVGTQTNNSLQKIKSIGNTATIFYNFGDQFVNGYRAQSRNDDWWPITYQPFVRWDNWNNNTDIDGQNVYIRTLGVNVFFAETTKLQINFNDKRGENLPVYKSSETLVQLQYGF